jgi:integrase
VTAHRAARYSTPSAVHEAKTLGHTRPTPKAWTRHQLGVFLRAVEGDRLEPLWRYLMVTGCRRGEACGVRWDDIDLDTGTVAVVNQRTIAAGTVIEGLPKTSAGVRAVALDATTVGMLRRWRVRQAEELLRLGVRPAVAYVFTSESGSPLWPQRVTSNFTGLCDALGLPRIGPHGLRHSMATSMIAAGHSPKLVSQRLGHADPAITLQLYSHVLPGHDQAAVDAFAAVLDSKTDRNVTTA